MRLHPRLALVGAVSALAMALNPAAALAHSGDHHGDNLIKADFMPSLPTDPPIFGVKAGGAPWILDEGDVRVRDDGRMDVELEGLQIPGFNADGTAANPVASINAILFCGGMPAANSGPQPLSKPGGDAEFRVWLEVPSSCDMATVLISPTASNGGAYIASAMNMDDDD